MSDPVLFQVSSPDCFERDVVFIHGISGDLHTAWTSDEFSFPKAISEDFPHDRVWSLGYDSSFFSGGANLDLSENASQFLLLLKAKKIGNIQIVFVTHSMGGLLLKQLLRHAYDNQNTHALFLQRTAGVAFISTPSSGAHLPEAIRRLVSILPMITTSKAMDDLKHASPYLVRLSEWYRIQAGQSLGSVQHAAYYETKKTYGVLVVDQLSANPGLTGLEMRPVGADHIEIAKPRDRDAFVYVTLCDFLREIRVGDGDLVCVQTFVPRLLLNGRSTSDIRRGIAAGLEVPVETLEVRIPSTPDVPIQPQPETHDITDASLSFQLTVRSLRQVVATYPTTELLRNSLLLSLREESSPAADLRALPAASSNIARAIAEAAARRGGGSIHLEPEPPSRPTPRLGRPAVKKRDPGTSSAPPAMMTG